MNAFFKSLAISSLTASITLIIYLMGILCGATINYIFIKNGKLR